MSNAPRVPSSPKSVDIAITGKCNLDCAYCFFADEMVARDDLPTEAWLRFFGELGSLGVMDVILTGGEVFTRRDFWQLIDGVIANRMRYGLLTNGTMITEETLEQWKVGKRRTRLNSVQISIDGSTEDVHNQSRPKSFSRAIRAVRLLKEARFPISVRVTINRYNIDDLENVVSLLLDDIGLPSISTNEAYPCGATDRYERGIRLSPEQRQQAMTTLTKLKEKYGDRVDGTAGPLVYAREFKRIDEALAQGITSDPGRGSLSACGGVFSRMAVLHDGTIVPCNVVHTLAMGNIQSGAFATIWRNHEIMNAMRSRRDIRMGQLDTCKGCKYQGFCSGGCPGGAVLLGLGLEARNPYDCYRVLRGEDPDFTLEQYEMPMNRIDIALGDIKNA